MSLDPAPIISNEDVIASITSKLGHNNFTILSQTITSSEQKLGLLSDHSYLNVVILNNVNNQEKTLNFFIKSFPKQQTFVHQFADKAFQKEEFAYDLFEKFAKYSDNIICNSTAKRFRHQPNKLIIIENLLEQGYYTPDKMECLDYDTILVVLHSLAQLHASSIIFEEKLSQESATEFRIYEGNGQIFQYSYFLNKDMLDSILKCILLEVQMFDISREINSELFDQIFLLNKPSEKNRNVICHGDLTVSNIMLKKHNTTGKVLGCKLVDFQNIIYAPPSHDLLTFIYLATSREFRDKHLYELLGIYYNYLEKILKISEIDVSNIIPFCDFLESCEEQKLYAVLFAVAMMPLILSKSIKSYLEDEDVFSKVFKVDRSTLVKENQDDEQFMKRMRETVEDLRDECDKFR